MEVGPLIKRILIVSVLLCMTVAFPAYGQGGSSISNLPSNWHPNTPYLYNPFQQNTYSLSMPYDSSNYKSRNLVKLPFVIVRNIDIAKDSYRVFSKFYDFQFSSQNVKFATNPFIEMARSSLPYTQ